MLALQMYFHQYFERQKATNSPLFALFSVEDYQRYIPVSPIGIADRDLRRRFDSLACGHGIDHTGAVVSTDMAEKKREKT
jgi:hypothetical protein